MTRTPTDALRGVLAFSITPFGDDLGLDVPRFEAHVDRLARSGLRAIVVAGNTGEFYSLSPTEIQTIASAAVRTLDGRGIVIVGAGHAVDDAVAAARSAEAVGADAVMVHGPANPYTTDAGYLAYVERIASSVGIGVIPYVRTMALARDTMMRLIALEGVVAVKYARPEPVELAHLISRARDVADLPWLCGIAERWAPFFWTAGAVGLTSGAVNVEAAPSLEFWRLLESGDRAGAMRVWDAIAPLEALRARHNEGANVAVLKEALRLLGRPAGSVRPPSSELDEATRREVPAALERLQSADLTTAGVR